MSLHLLNMPVEYMTAAIAAFVLYLRRYPNQEIGSEGEVTIPYQNNRFVVTRNQGSYSVEIK